MYAKQFTIGLLMYSHDVSHFNDGREQKRGYEHIYIEVLSERSVS